MNQELINVFQPGKEQPAFDRMLFAPSCRDRQRLRVAAVA